MTNGIINDISAPGILNASCWGGEECVMHGRREPGRERGNRPQPQHEHQAAKSAARRAAIAPR